MRAHYTKLIQTELRQIKKFKEQAEKRSSPDNILKLENKIKELEHELDNDETTRYMEYMQEQQDVLKTQQKHLNDKHQKSQMEAENQEKLCTFYKKENQIRRDDRMLQNQMRREWDWLCRQDERLPDYIRTNLQKMPNNKGYIWKSIHYYGCMPAEKNNDLLIMFERMAGSPDMLIHEIKKGHYYKIFQKGKTTGNILLSEKRLTR